MPRYKVILEYDGTAFHGWQKQKNAVGIQNLLEEKVAVLFREALRVEGASRTDAGVHARGQVIAFSAAQPKEPSLILRGLNGLLPQAIRAREVEEVPGIFDPRRDAMSKEYRYTWWAHPAHSPFWRRYSWHAREGLDEVVVGDRLPGRGRGRRRDLLEIASCDELAWGVREGCGHGCLLLEGCEGAVGPRSSRAAG